MPASSRTGSTPSTIAGHLNANGQVYLVNPNGIAITKTGVVKVGGGFVASTLGMSDAEFVGGRKRFKGDGASAAVTNAGTVSIGRGGYAALMGVSREPDLYRCAVGYVGVYDLPLMRTQDRRGAQCEVGRRRVLPRPAPSSHRVEELPVQIHRPPLLVRHRRRPPDDM